jgi:hypothetical protein
MGDLESLQVRCDSHGAWRGGTLINSGSQAALLVCHWLADVLFPPPANSVTASVPPQGQNTAEKEGVKPAKPRPRAAAKGATKSAGLTLKAFLKKKILE